MLFRDGRREHFFCQNGLPGTAVADFDLTLGAEKGVVKAPLRPHPHTAVLHQIDTTMRDSERRQNLIEGALKYLVEFQALRYPG